MNLIWDCETFAAVRAFSLTHFNASVLSPGDALRLTAVGMLGRVSSSTLPANVRRPLCADMNSLMANAMLLHFDESAVSAADVAALLLATTDVHSDMVPFLNAHCRAVVQMLDPDMLLCVMAAHADAFADFERVTPLMPFYACALARLAGEGDAVDVLRAMRLHPALALGVHSETVLPEELARTLGSLPDAAVRSAYRYMTVPWPLLRELWRTRGILPYNPGLLSEEDPAELAPVLEAFMARPHTDFAGFVSARALRTPALVNVLMRTLCVHDSRRAIRAALLHNMSYAQLVQRVGLRVHACIGTRDEMYEYRYPATRLTHASLRELKFVLDHVMVYVNVMGLQDDLCQCLQEHAELWEHNANACLYALDREHTEEMYMRALSNARTLFSEFAFVTGAMLQAIVERDLFQYAPLRDMVSLEQLLPFRERILQREDVCLEPNSELLMHDAMLEAYAAKFADDPMFLYMVAHSPLPHARRVRLLSTLSPAHMPPCRLVASMYSAAYLWAPRSAAPAYVLIVPADFSLPAAENPYARRVLALQGDTLLQLGPEVRRKMHVHQVARSAGGLRSVPECEHQLVYVHVGAVRTVALQYRVLLPAYAGVCQYIALLARDLLLLLSRGLLYHVVLWPHARDVDFRSFGAADMLATARRSFSWENYRTLNDELIRFSPVFVCSNHYMARARVYTYHAMQYFSFCLLLWRDHAPGDPLLPLLEELCALFTQPGEPRAGAHVLLRAAAELEEHLLRGAHELRDADVLFEDVFAEFVLSQLPLAQ
ncbi:MC043L [Molluscum contagiosum virus subtype 1]|uniref:MC043L n=3 Tax=Molluscum contagiosum virus TaxID=10279 RepID=A0A7G5AX43_MCV1|nr:MC043L [Molluscum contagiosum virus subtype 1]AZT86205.1 MC043L [Molluscum contagiosum virus]AAC55171.1 MC043L [Molluscum contagiosum virus subtype 1]AQY16789.1 MC043 [Molluscum contagiosum virus subtype 1]AQY16969.1 MC043 [Molluscum contagiosum virus subtype 1]AQY17149.1 MC043 [Molluscum contagiosum virus subtype 1]